MVLEDILKTTKAVLGTVKEDLWNLPDEWVRQQYEQIEEKLGKQKTKMGIAAMCFIPPLVSGFPQIEHPTPIVLYSIITGSSGMALIPRYFFNNYETATASNEDIPLEKDTLTRRYGRYMRFPLLIATAASLYYPLVENMHYAAHSFVGLGVISAFYLSDKSPRKFDKDPFWKRVYDVVTEKIKEYRPQPVPVPIPIPVPVRPRT